MVKTIKLLTTLAIFILMSSFAGEKNTVDYIGIYSVSTSDPSQIKLSINSDNTFYYQDFSNPENKIVVNGSWKLNGKRVILNQNSSAKKFHSIWTFEENGRVAKSRKGFTFYRLIKISK